MARKFSCCFFVAANMLFIANGLHAQMLAVYQDAFPPNNFFYFNGPGDFTDELNSAFDNNVIVVSDLQGVCRQGVTAVWLDGHVNAMPDDDLVGLAEFVESGGHVLMVGENSAFSGAWNSSVLQVLGGDVGSDISATASGASLVSHDITQDVTEVFFGGSAAGTANAGIQVFTVANTVSIWGENQNAVSVLDYNWLREMELDNQQFRHNVAQWLAAAELLLGDVNCDGVVNLLDVAPFVDLISNSTFEPRADINSDGSVNLLDVAPFVSLLSGG